MMEITELKNIYNFEQVKEYVLKMYSSYEVSLQLQLDHYQKSNADRNAISIHKIEKTISDLHSILENEKYIEKAAIVYTMSQLQVVFGAACGSELNFHAQLKPSKQKIEAFGKEFTIGSETVVQYNVESFRKMLFESVGLSFVSASEIMRVADEYMELSSNKLLKSIDTITPSKESYPLYIRYMDVSEQLNTLSSQSLVSYKMIFANHFGKYNVFQNLSHKNAYDELDLNYILRGPNKYLPSRDDTPSIGRK